MRHAPFDSVPLNIKVPPEVRAALEAAAAERDEGNISLYVRRVLRAALQRDGLLPDIR
jgi:hypothetical protein